MKKYLLFCFKLALSGILALGILSLFCLVYYDPPIAIPQPEGYTNYKFIPNDRWSSMTEGYGRGVTNSLGYNDLQDPVAGEKTICFLGSSQTEALQVDGDENFVALLEQRLSSDGDDTNDYQCLNLGASGHFFDTVVSTFESFAATFKGVDYVVIEVDGVEFSGEQIQTMLNGGYYSPLAQRGFLQNALQRVPYLRLIVKQYRDLRQNSAAAPAAEPGERNVAGYAELLDPVMKKLARISQEHGFELVILKHSHVAFDENNKAYATSDAEVLAQFETACRANGIRFLCTDERFCAYADAHMELPYGFSNSQPGSGHLNEAGHQLVAEQLYSELFDAKEGK